MVVVIAAATFGFDPSGVRERVLGSATAPARRAATGRQAVGATPGGAAIPAPAAPVTRLRSQPWWRALGTYEGSGPASIPQFTVASDAIQWRVRWWCNMGRLAVNAAGAGRALVSMACPGADTAYGSQKGPVNLQVTAESSWRLEVDQQIDLPLDEPLLATMSAPGAAKVATGELYRIDQFADGRVDLYSLPDGTWALRLEGFYVTPNSDLTVQLSPLSAPKSTQHVMAGASVSVGPLDVTAGSMNIPIPSDIDPTKYQSVVIWCGRELSAYAAAALVAVP